MADKKNDIEESSIEKLNDNLSSAGEKIAQNKKTLYWILFAVLVIAILIISYIFFLRNPKNQRANEAFNQVELTAQGNDSIAAREYAKVADNFGGTAAGKNAALAAAESYYNNGDFKSALKYLEQFSTSEPVLAANALVLEGDCYVNLNKMTEALASYEKAISKAGKNEQIVPRVLLKEANIYDFQKKYGEALKCYETIKSEYPRFVPGNGMTMDAFIERENARLGK